MALNYSFYPDRGETPATLAERRLRADILAGRIGGGTANIGEGIGDIFRGLGAGLSRYRTDKMQKAGDAGAKSGMDRLMELMYAQPSNQNIDQTGYTGQPVDVLAQASKSISGIESGGNYSATGPVTRTGDRAYGKYQVMGANIPEWTEAALGQRLTPEQFLASQDAQEAVFRHRFGGYLEGNSPEDAASMWFTGKPLAQGADLSDQLGTTGQGYVDKFNAGFSGDGMPMVPQLATYTPPQPAGGHTAPQQPGISPEQSAAWNDPKQYTGTEQALIPPQAPQPVDPAQSMAPAQQPVMAQMQPMGNDASLIPQIMEVLRNPFVSDQDKAFLQQRLEDIQKKQDPAYQTDLQLKQLQLQQTRDPSSIPLTALQQLELDQKTDPSTVPLSQAEQANIDFQNEKFEFEKSKGDPAWEKLTDGSLFNRNTGEVKTVPGPPPAADFKDVNILRKEVQDTIPIKNYQQAAPIYRSMVETAPRNTKASDMNMVFGLGKIVDPTSVVRDGDRIAAQNTAALPDFLIGAINTLNGGAMLQPETRAAIMVEAKTRMDAYAAEANALKSQYEGIAKRHNINMDDIWQPLDKLPDYTPAIEINGYTIKKVSP